VGKVIVFALIGFGVITAIFVGGTRLVVYWRDTARRWRMENHRDRIRLLEAENAMYKKALSDIHDIDNLHITEKSD